MGGRGASSGTSQYGNPYGSQYRTVAKKGNVLFVTKMGRSSETIMETMTSGRVYAHVEGRDLKSIVYFDRENKRGKQIDLSHAHNGKAPHVHHGYEFEKGGHDATGLSSKERLMVDRVAALWQNEIGK